MKRVRAFGEMSLRQQDRITNGIAGLTLVGIVPAIAVGLLAIASLYIAGVYLAVKACEGVHALFSGPKDGNASALELVTVAAFLVLATLGVMSL